MTPVILHKAKAVTANYKLEQMLESGCTCGPLCSLKTFNVHGFQQCLHLVGNTDAEK